APTPYSGDGASCPGGPAAPAGPAGPAAPVSPVVPLAPAAPVAPCGPWPPCGPAGPAGPAGPPRPFMFHEIVRAPLPNTNEDMFRSPEVALLPFVAGSTHAVTTPLRTPGLRALLAAAIAATAANKLSTTTASNFLDGGFITRSS